MYKTIELLPGVILHDAIVAAFKARGDTLQSWCRENKIDRGSIGYATHGNSRGPKGKKLLNKVVDAASRELVILNYRHRLLHEAKLIEQVAV